MGAGRDILVAMDWTDFDHDSQSTLVLSLVTGHGRAASLIWLSVWKDEIATRRNDYEDACLRRLAENVPQGCRVTILADRGSTSLWMAGCSGARTCSRRYRWVQRRSASGAITCFHSQPPARPALNERWI